MKQTLTYLEKLDELQVEINRLQRAMDAYREQCDTYGVERKHYCSYFPKERGSIRRASLDLTRQLAVFRKS